VRDDGEEVALQPLPLAVLSYLALGGPRDRDHLADLFWHGNKNGLNSLSTTLNRIRAEMPDGLWVRGNHLVGTDLATDVGQLRDAIGRSDFEVVTELYKAPFLGNLKLRRQSEEFEEWVLEERARLASMVELTLLQRGRDLHGAGEYGAAAIVAEEAWEIATRDSFPSADYFEAYHRILASAGRPSANAVRTMADEFGIALPPVEPVAFEPSNKPLRNRSSGSRSRTGRDLGSAGSATPLFGCLDELKAIASSVSSQRLTTIVGLGGSGKTRLAAEFFSSPDTERDFPRRYWVNLRDINDHPLVAPAIAAALGQRFEDVATLADQLRADEPVLLVLDNFEHVVKAADIAEQLVNANRGLRILVTSRVPLALADESLVQLSGLNTSDDADDSPAEQLFVSAARRAGVGDDRLTDQSRTAVREVCRRVGGNPLALEIAGGWVQILSATEILGALTVDNELLGSPMVGGVRTMDVVLDQSWSTLSESEQNTLMLLAAFPAGCLTSEALKLPGLSTRAFGRLVQHSLVRLHVEGRITLHPLIASHALAELDQRPDLKREFQQVLSNWCEAFSTVIESRSTTAYSHEYAAEIPNLSSAWSWAAENGLWQLYRTTLTPLRTFFADSGRVSEGKALFTEAADALRSSPNPPQDLLAACLEALGRFDLMSGELAQAHARLDEALSLCPSDDRLGRAQIFRSLGALHLNRGEIDQATANFNEGLALVIAEPIALTASLQYDLAQVHHYRGEREQATNAARLALEAGRSAKNWTVMTGSYLLLADIEVETDPQRAIVLLNEGWTIAKEASVDALAIYFPHVLGLAHLKLRDANRAEQCFSDGLDAANDVGQLQMASANYVGRGEARLLGGEIAEASHDLQNGLRLALNSGAGRYLMWAAVVSCRVAVARQAPSTLIKELLLLTLSHPAADQDAKDKATESLRELFGESVEPEVTPVDDAPHLDEIAERSLQILAVK